MKMRKIVAALLLLSLFCACFAACGETTESLSGEYMGPKGERYIFTKRTLTITGVIEGLDDTSLHCSYRIVTEAESMEAAREMCDLYEEKIRKLTEERKKADAE